MPLSGPPPKSPCDPTLVLELGLLSSGMTEYFDDVYRNDLVFSRGSQWKKALPKCLDDFTLLNILNFLDGPTLMNMCQAYNASVLMPESTMYDENGFLQHSTLKKLRKQRFQAIIVSDDGCSSDEEILYYLTEQASKGVNIVVMALQGLFDLGFMHAFGVNWKLCAYTRRTFHLTKDGMRILGKSAFPFKSCYCMSHFVTGDGYELFAELLEDEDEEPDDDDDDDDDYPPRQPEPGSPVIVHINDTRSVSYFGFVNPSNVSYGAILLRLCFAPQYYQKNKRLDNRIQLMRDAVTLGQWECVR